MKKKLNCLELTNKELDDLTELAYIGKKVVNFYGRKKPIKRYEESFNKIFKIFKINALKRYKDIDEVDIHDHLSDVYSERMNEYEDEMFAETLACKLVFMKGDVAKIRDAIMKSKIFED